MIRCATGTSSAALAALALAGAIGCHRGGGGLAQADCAPQLSVGSGSATVGYGPSSSSLDIDFGPLLLGQQSDEEILISNSGSASIQILSLDPPAAGAGFEVALSSSAPVEPAGQPLIVALRFRPLAASQSSSQVRLVTDCSSGDLILNLRGEGVLPLLGVSPPILDFGRVLVGSQAERVLTLTNDSDAPRSLTVFPEQSPDSALFRIQSQPPAMLAPHQQAMLSIVFSPTDVTRLPSQAALALALDCTGCTAEVALTGLGVVSGLSITPYPIDFGFVEPPYPASAALYVENVANAPIQLLTAPAIVQPSPEVFQLGPAAFLPGTNLLPGTRVVVPMIFVPAGIGRYQGTLVFTTTDPFQSNVSVPILGTSGGPRIRCSPEAVDFGDVGVGIETRARVTCTNVGVGNPSDSSANLFFEIATDSPLFSASFESPFPVDGLFSGAASKVVIDLGFTPGAGNPESGNLVVTSNDPTTPVLLIPAQGTGVELPPCVADIQPARLDFGQVGRGLTRDLTFTVANKGAVDCLLNGVDLTSDSSSAFSLPNGPVLSQRLSPSGSSSGYPSQFSDTVRFAPPLNHDFRYLPESDSANFNGVVSFSISDPTTPVRQVPLSGVSPDDCLVLDPATPDLGSVPYDGARQLWCSASRTLTVSNVCEQDAQLDALEADAGLGASQDLLIAGPGGSTGPWTIPALLSGGAPVPFQIVFRPSAANVTPPLLEAESHQYFPQPNIGGDCGYAIGAVPATIDAQDAILGSAQPDGGRVDSFTGRGTQVDVLWIVDTLDENGWQVAPSDLASFLQYPAANGIDFQMAVTTTSAVGAAPAVDAPQDFGYFEPCDHCWNLGSSATIIAPASQPDPASLLAPLISIGGLPSRLVYDVECPGFDDQFFESYVEAFQPDLLAGHNAGFLRPNAVLAVIALGDDDNEQSTGSFAFFYNFLVGIKGQRGLVSFSFASNPTNEPAPFFDLHNRHLSLMVQLTGGVIVDATLPGWMGQLGQVWTGIANQLFRYALSSLPADPTPYDPATHPGGLQIRANGQLVPPNGATGLNWHYDSSGNAVIFEPLAAPPAGAALTVSYALACEG